MAKDPLKIKTDSQLKHKKVFIYYIVRRVNNLWEVQSPFHKVQTKTLEGAMAAIQALEGIDSEIVTAPTKPNIKIPKKAKRKSK